MLTYKFNNKKNREDTIILVKAKVESHLIANNPFTEIYENDYNRE